eukprot:1444111-Pyramimonas_sp.AAC.1
MAQPMGGRFIIGGRGRNLWRNQSEDYLFSAAEGATYGETNRSPLYSRRPRGATYGATNKRTDVAQTGWTSNCVRGFTRFMLAV